MSDAEIYEPDLTFAPENVLRRCAEQYGTPLLIYDRRTLTDRQRMLGDAFAWNSKFQQYFPVRATDEPGVLRLLAQEGSGAVCANRLELRLALLAGFPEERILFLSAFPERADVEAAYKMGCTGIVNSLEQLRWYQSLGCLPQRIGLRFQPDHRFHLRGHLSVLTGPSKFGMSSGDIFAAARLLREEAVEELGLHIQLSSNEKVSGYMAAMAEALLELVPEVERVSGRAVAWCDIGGGLAASDRKRPDVDLREEAEQVRNAFEKAGMGTMALHTQMGRFVTGPAGILLTRVLGVRGGQRNFLGVDASMADLPRSAMTGVGHHISLLGSCSVSGRLAYYVEGSSMEKLDHHGKRHILPKTNVGDILVFHDAGAYTRSMASNYGGSLRCPVLLLDGEKAALLRRRETEADYFGLFSDQQQEQ